jgi:hypothetical protein
MLSSLQVRYTSTWAMMLIVVGFGFMLIVASRTGLSAAYPDPHAIKFEERLQSPATKANHSRSNSLGLSRPKRFDGGSLDLPPL